MIKTLARVRDKKNRYGGAIRSKIGGLDRGAINNIKGNSFVLKYFTKGS